MKEKLIQDILIAMSGKLTADQAQELKLVFYLKLQDYELQEKTTELTIRDQSNFTLLARYIATIQQRGYAEGTVLLYKQRLLNLLMWVNKPVVEITADDLRTYLAYYKSFRKVTNRTLDGVRKNIRSFWIWMQKEDIVLKNEAVKLDKIKYPTILQRPFSDEDRAKIHDACKHIRDLAMIEVLYSTGVRVSELVRMNREDVINGEAIVFGKGSKERKVYFSGHALHYLNEYLASRDDDNPALFVTLDKPHKRLAKNGIEARIRNLGTWAGVEKTHPHRYRHTMATNAVHRGMPIQEVQKLLGHAQISTTLIYAEVNQDDVKSSHAKYVA